MTFTKKPITKIKKSPQKSQKVQFSRRRSLRGWFSPRQIVITLLLLTAVAALPLAIRESQKSQENRSDASAPRAQVSAPSSAKSLDTAELVKLQEQYRTDEPVMVARTTANQYSVPQGVVTRKVMIIDFNPKIQSVNNKPLWQVMSWRNPEQLETDYIKEINAVSGKYLNYAVVERQAVNAFPVKSDGFVYTDDSYFNCLISRGVDCHNPDEADLKKILADFQVCEKRNRDEIHEVWLWGGTYFGFPESQMAGPGAYASNRAPLLGTTCLKPLHIMGFNYRNSVAEMFENMGHRIENSMRKAYSESRDPFGPPGVVAVTVWDKFSARGFDVGSAPGCGTIHGSLNSSAYDPNNYWSYDATNTNIVQSTCEEWKKYPNLTGTTTPISCTVWGCTNYGFRRYWLDHLPKAAGKTDGKLNNWWAYAIDYENAFSLPQPDVAVSPTLPIPIQFQPSPSPSPSPVPTPKPVDNSLSITTQSLTGNAASFKATIEGISTKKDDTLRMSVSGLPAGVKLGTCLQGPAPGNKKYIRCSLTGKAKVGTYPISVKLSSAQASMSKNILLKVSALTTTDR